MNGVPSLKITVLGSGTSTGVPVPCCSCPVCQSSDPKNSRLRVSVLVEARQGDQKSCILIDTGPDLRQQALRYHITQIDAVLYTHTHADHIFGFDDLRAFSFARGGPIPLYAGEHARKELERIFSYTFFPDPRYQGASVAKIEMTTLVPGSTTAIAGIPVLPLTVFHGPEPILGYRIGNFAYLTDCSSIPFETLEKLSGVEVLILDGLRYREHKTHFNIEQAIAVAEQLQPRQTVLTHLSHDVEYQEGTAYVRARTQLPVELAYDGLEISLPLEIASY